MGVLTWIQSGGTVFQLSKVILSKRFRGKRKQREETDNKINVILSVR